MTAQESKIGEFLSAHGGPFYELQLRLKMLQEHTLRSARRAILFVAAAWVIPLILSIIAGRAFGPLAAGPYILDIGVWAWFVIAIAVFIHAEGRVEEQLRHTLRQFTRAPLLAPTSFEQAARAVSAALKQRDSRAAEAICIVLAIALLSLTNVTQHGAHSWAVHVGPGGSSLTAAGWWCLLFSNPLFFFLLLRRLGRHLVWSRFVEVKRAAQAELQSLHRIRDRMVGNRTRLI